jgi:hypothetical protein
MSSTRAVYRPGRLVIAAACILLLPAIGMLLTEEVAWSAHDFLLAGIILVAPAMMYETVSRKTGNLTYRAALATSLLSAVFLVWVNLAVGFIGEPSHPANLMYAGVLALAVVGSAVTRLRPRGMSVTMLMTAMSLVLISCIVLFKGYGAEALVLSATLAALLAGAAYLFKAAAKEMEPDGAVAGSGWWLLQSRLAAIGVAVGGVFLAFMIIVEGEPGAIPLAMLLLGTGWFFVARRRA